MNAACFLKKACLKAFYVETVFIQGLLFLLASLLFNDARPVLIICLRETLKRLFKRGMGFIRVGLRKVPRTYQCQYNFPCFVLWSDWSVKPFGDHLGLPTFDQL